MNLATARSLADRQWSSLPIPWLRQEWLAPRLVAVTLLAMALGWLAVGAGLPRAVTLSLHLCSYLAGGFFGAKAALESLRAGEIDVDLLMILAALGAAAIGQWHEGAALLFLFSLSNVLQSYAIGRSRRAIRSLFKLYPEVAKVRRGDATLELEISQIKRGDTVLIEPGERIPVDGRVIAGASAVDESPITGESMPADKHLGARVFAGSLNHNGMLDVRAEKLAEQTTLARIIQLVEEAQESKAPTERFLDRFEQRYAKLIILCVTLFAILPPALGMVDFHSNFYRAMALMTVASPCALVISVPAAFISAIASAARHGTLFKGGASLEQLAATKVFAFDKTGTLTRGQPQVTDLVCQADLDEAELLRLAASAEARSEHPLAKAIVARSIEAGLSLEQPLSFSAHPGQGVQALLASGHIQVGKLAQWAKAAALPSALRGSQARLESQGKTVVGVMRDGQWLGLIALADQCRAEAAGLIASLRQADIIPVMLTGDNRRAAQSIAAQLGISRVYAELMPQDKAAITRQLQSEYGSVAMVGDGINDAPAMAAADVSIAMGGAGADVALETADAVIMGDRLERLLDAIKISARARLVVRQNIAFSIAVIALLIAGVFLVDLPLPLGVLGHEGSTVIVVLNGLLSLLVLPEISRRRLARMN